MYLIPMPRKLTAQDGLFMIDSKTDIVLAVVQDDKDLETAKLLQLEIKKVIAMTLPIKKSKEMQVSILKTAFSFNIAIWIVKKKPIG